jgi:hypothetical protein
MSEENIKKYKENGKSSFFSSQRNLISIGKIGLDLTNEFKLQIF